jgi:hypothetical protein
MPSTVGPTAGGGFGEAGLAPEGSRAPPGEPSTFQEGDVAGAVPGDCLIGKSRGETLARISLAMVGATPTDRAFADRVARAVISTYDSLPKNGKPMASEWTILAGIVASRPRHGGAGRSGVEGVQGDAPGGDVAEEELEVVALATGSKCLSGVKLRKDGKVLNDSHAEVLARCS